MSKAGKKPVKAYFEDGTYDLEEFHRVFVESEDPTGYTAAMRLIGNWQEWERFKRDWPTFRHEVAVWVEEIEVRLKSKAINQINKLAFSDDNYQANKWLAEEGYHKRTGAGRPTKSEKARAAKEMAEQAAETKQDKDRVLKLINGTG